MKIKPLILTTSVLALAALVTHFATRPPQLAPDDPREGQPLVPADTLEQASRLKITANNQTTELLRQADGTWVTPSYYDMPVEFSRLQAFTDSLANAKVQDLVTRRPERIARLDLDGSKVVISSGAGKEWAVSIGKTAENGARFVRFGDEAAAFTSDFSGWLDGTPKSWANSALLSLKPEEVKSVTVPLLDGTQVALNRGKAEDEFTAANLPEGRTLAKSKVTSLLSGLSSIRFSESVPLDDPDAVAARAHSRVATLETFDGKRYTVTFMRAPADPVPSPAPSATPVPPKEKPVYIKVESSDPANQMNAIMQKRAFQTYAYAFTSLPSDWAALTDVAAAPTPAPTPQPPTPPAPK